MKTFSIDELYTVQEKDYDKMYKVLKRAFAPYPKLAGIFTDPEVRAKAIDMTLQYYAAFDLAYGSAFSLDSELKEIALILHSDEMDYAEDRLTFANCENAAFNQTRSLLSEEDQQMWYDFFDELGEKEAGIDIPSPCIYIDFIGVDPAYQNQGRGTKLLDIICRKAAENNLPVMLFTNGEDHIRFYENRGFHVIGIAKSEKFPMENIYMVYSK